MKTRYFFIILLSIVVNNSNAQWINSIIVSPVNPTTTDTIYVYADCSFPSGSCDSHTQFAFVNGNVINAGATHCLGMLTVICDATDTFKINPLQANNYKFVFNINYGAYPAPCSPGINPGPTDSISFTVSTASSIPEIDKYLFQFDLFPNPVKEQLHFVCKDESILSKDNSLVIYSLTGQELFTSKIKSKEMLIDVSQLPQGIYMCRIFGDGVNEKHWMEIIR